MNLGSIAILIWNLLHYLQMISHCLPEHHFVYYQFFYFPLHQSFLSEPQSKPKQNQTYAVLQPKELQQIFIQNLRQEIQGKHKLCYVKEWSYEDDQKLLNLGPTCRNWKHLANNEFLGKSSKVCKRRYNKLLRRQKKWPRQDELKIKHLREFERKTWMEIEVILKKQRGFRQEYTAKKIRQRYKNFLQHEMSRQKWTITEDLELWRLVQQLGRAWNTISDWFPHRSGLQIRNRYYKFLEPAAMKVKQEMSHRNQSIMIK